MSRLASTKDESRVAAVNRICRLTASHLHTHTLTTLVSIHYVTVMLILVLVLVLVLASPVLESP